MLESEILLVDRAMETLRQMLFLERPNPLTGPSSRGPKIDDFEHRYSYVLGRLGGLKQEYYQGFYAQTTDAPYAIKLR